MRTQVRTYVSGQAVRMRRHREGSCDHTRSHGHCRYLGWRWRFEDVRFLFPFLFYFKHVVCVFLLRSTVRKRKGAAALTLTLVEPARVALCQSCRADMRAISLQCQVCHCAPGEQAVPGVPCVPGVSWLIASRHLKSEICLGGGGGGGGRGIDTAFIWL